jgi:hypothetical protein
VQHEYKRDEDLNGDDRRRDRGADPGGKTKPRKRLPDHAGCLIA